jgi:peptide/nickel transport system permease protein
MKIKYGLDQPFLVQFFDYFTGVFRGDLGTSFFSQREVTEVVAMHLPVTLMIILLSMGGAILISIPIALSVALSRRKFVTYFFRTSTSISLAIPGFFLALLGLLLFGTVVTWVPAAGYEGNFPSNLKYLWLPALVNCFSLVPILARVLLLDYQDLPLLMPTLEVGMVVMVQTDGLRRQSADRHEPKRLT